MEQLEYIPMEADFRQEIRYRYIKPLRRNISILTGCLLLIYALISISILPTKEQEAKSVLAGMLFVTVGFLIMFIWFAYPKFRKLNLHYLKDAEFGQIIKERTYITKVFDTPAGINIYWLGCDAIKTFTPDPYRIFREGDWVTIYYLKFSKEYLAYEL